MLQISSKNSPTQRVTVGNLSFGGNEFVVIAGPCSVESHSQFLEIAQSVSENGASMLRGGIFKMRTHSDSFQGLGSAAFEIAARVRNQVGLPLVSEVTDPRQIGPMSEIVDMFQVGARNMHNYELLKELGRTDKPVLLKRGFSALIEEWIAAADYVRKAGNSKIVLCERGIRTFEKLTRNTLDLSAVAYIKTYTDLPVVVDPSHGTGLKPLIPAMCLAAAAAGADGLLLEVHHSPEEALSDGEQALDFDDFAGITTQLNHVLQALNKTLRNFPAKPSKKATEQK